MSWQSLHVIRLTAPSCVLPAGACCNSYTAELTHSVRAPPQHGLSSNKMALTTSDCGTMCSPRTSNSPIHPGLRALQKYAEPCVPGLEFLSVVR